MITCKRGYMQGKGGMQSLGRERDKNEIKNGNKRIVKMMNTYAVLCQQYQLVDKCKWGEGRFVCMSVIEWATIDYAKKKEMQKSQQQVSDLIFFPFNIKHKHTKQDKRLL